METGLVEGLLLRPLWCCRSWLLKDAIKRGFRCHIDSPPSQNGYDLAGWQTLKLWLVGYIYNRHGLFLTQLVVRDWPLCKRSLICRRRSLDAPALQSSLADPDLLAGHSLPGACFFGFFDQHAGSSAIRGADQASALSPQIAFAFFLSTSNAAVSASAASFLRSSRSSNLISFSFRCSSF